MVVLLLEYWLDFYVWAAREAMFVQVAIGLVLAVMSLVALYGFARLLHWIVIRTFYRLWSAHVTQTGFWLLLALSLVLVVGAYALLRRLGYWQDIAAWLQWLLGL